MTTASPTQRDPWNDSIALDCLWTRGNIGEAVPDVVTPCSRSILTIVFDDMMPTLVVGSYGPVGCIGGRLYLNLSTLMTVVAAVGMSRKRLLDAVSDLFGRVPDDVTIPTLPVRRWTVLRSVIPATVRNRRRIRRNVPLLPGYLATNPDRCAHLLATIDQTHSAEDLLDRWHRDLLPLLHQGNLMLEAASKSDGGDFLRVRKQLRRLVGDGDADLLLRSTDGELGQLASLGPIEGLGELRAGRIDRATYLARYGHHSAHLFELSSPRPAEDPAWIDSQLAAPMTGAGADILLARQQEHQAAAWQRFVVQYPRQVRAMRRTLLRARGRTRLREAARSEQARILWPVRSFVRRAGRLTALDDDVFFLSIEEILDALRGSAEATANIPERRAAYGRYAELPDYPALIRGVFHPFAWAADPHRRSDLWDASTSTTPEADIEVRGSPGSGGTADGRVRVVLQVEDAAELEPGEVLVTTVTNVGWTPVFPRAAAIVTDVGAPLSHAAIVARELGIPAVVGCGNATMRLRTGDRVRVDGTRGTVQVIDGGDVAARDWRTS